MKRRYLEWTFWLVFAFSTIQLLHAIGKQSLAKECQVWGNPDKEMTTPTAHFYIGYNLLKITDWSLKWSENHEDERAFHSYRCTLSLMMTLKSNKLPQEGWSEYMGWVTSHREELNELFAHGHLKYSVISLSPPQDLFSNKN